MKCMKCKSKMEVQDIGAMGNTGAFCSVCAVEAELKEIELKEAYIIEYGSAPTGHMERYYKMIAWGVDPAFGQSAFLNNFHDVCRTIAPLTVGGVAQCVVCKKPFDGDNYTWAEDILANIHRQADYAGTDSLTEQEQTLLEAHICSEECYYNIP